jgi:hypothetical protein
MATQFDIGGPWAMGPFHGYWRWVDGPDRVVVVVVGTDRHARRAGAVLAFTDITERLASEKAIRERDAAEI